MKRTLLALISATLLLCLFVGAVGCNSADTSDGTDDATPTEAPTDKPTEAPTEEPTEEPTEAPTEKPTEIQRPITPAAYSLFDDWRSFKICGRVQYDTKGIVCDSTASGIEFTGVMKGLITVELDCDDDTYFSVYIDGVKLEERLFADKDTEFLTIADLGDEAAEHTVRLLKQTEPQWSLCLMKTVAITGYLLDPPADKDFYIEFIGDSLTTGYGNLGDSRSQDPGTAIWQDGTEAYAFLAAEELGADYTIAAASGVGIDKGWTNFSMDDFYPSASYYRSKAKDHYDPRTPDLIVINIGTNDQDCGSSKEKFVQGVKDLINYLRETYNEDVTIIWAYNLGGYGCDDWAFEAIEELGGEDNGIYTLRMEHERSGANGHPNLEGHLAAKDVLVDFINEKKLLK